MRRVHSECLQLNGSLYLQLSLTANNFDLKIIIAKMELTTVLLAILLLALSAFFCYMYRYKNYVYSLGIPIDTAVVWNMHKVKFCERDVKNLKKFGKVWIDYTSTVPEIFVADPDMVKEIMVKHFDSFVNRAYGGVEDRHASILDARCSFLVRFFPIF